MTYQDTKLADGFYIQWSRIIAHDDTPWDGECEAPEYLLTVHAEAHCFVVSGGVGTHLTLTSPGLYGVGVNDPDDPYLEEVYGEQKAELLATIEAMRNPIQSETARPKYEAWR